MIKEFFVKTDIGTLVGYDFHVGNPDYVVAMVHGVGEHMGRYRKMAYRMNENNIAMTGIDLRGHGASVGKRGDCQPRRCVLDDIDQLIENTEKLYPGVPIVLYGHSLGGNIVLDYRKRGSYNSKPAGYIVSSPWIELVRKVSKPLYFAMKNMAKVMPSKLIGTDISSDEIAGTESACERRHDPLIHGYISLACALDGYEIGKALADGTLEGNDAAKGKKILLMQGLLDCLCTVEGFRKVAAQEDEEYAEIIEWEGLFHEVHNGGPDSNGSEVVDKVISFIKSLEKGAKPDIQREYPEWAGEEK